MRPFVLDLHGTGYSRSMSEKQEAGLSPEELERENGEPLPDREQMTVIKQPWEQIGGDGYTTPVEPPATE